MSLSGKVWFITGTSRGFGRVWAQAALERGDRVAATARNVDDIVGLSEAFGDAVLLLRLDVRDRAAVRDAVAAAVEHFGRLDVLVNNAGYGLFGPVETIGEEEARDQLDTNFFGTLWATQAALPVMRRQGSGHLVQVSSIAGLASWPMLGLYHASKWAIEGLSEALAQEVARFGIRVTLLEPGPYRTDWRGDSAVWADPGPVYADVAKPPSAGSLPGDPGATAGPLLDIVDAPNPPLRVLFGGTVLQTVRSVYEDRLGTWERWSSLARAAQGE
ncbi:SDR family NAD(P)-dependent oxidoreductase [Streptomyces sp. SCSIO 75703]|uniref:SDR family NAD(P)-dependent oxidoreductase n=1 Tax=unclassified Streptomyces TaxID=2593676 RepID=UPI001F44FF0E|nr:SDR family NAD(P)-dependent oxidoreductase [Streptomyces sp. TP-A0875]